MYGLDCLNTGRFGLLICWLPRVGGRNSSASVKSEASVGAFHVYHTSCHILWMLSIEFEIVCNQSVGPKVGKRSKKKNGDKSNSAGKDGTVNTFSNPTVSVFCPECQVFQYQMKVCDGYRGWMKSPEILDNCSTVCS
uniref:Uncharacterized protein n=1 Tax=Salix viminalis TaxID=40686 RepID=A0A6N2KZ86_SALVM